MNNQLGKSYKVNNKITCSMTHDCCEGITHKCQYEEKFVYEHNNYYYCKWHHPKKQRPFIEYRGICEFKNCKNFYSKGSKYCDEHIETYENYKNQIDNDCAFILD